tara:strand:- start:4363 stop:4851 length:489 start_codon:yes stop_codon:yes gene_type:complete
MEEYRLKVKNGFEKEFKKQFTAKKLKEFINELDDELYQLCKFKSNNDLILLENLYLNIAHNLLINLTSDNIKDVKSNKFTVKNIIEFKPWEYNPKQWEEYIKEQIKEDKIEMTQTPKQTTNLYTCGRCKQNKCSTYQLQTRSADESMTLFVTCNNCNKTWKM